MFSLGEGTFQSDGVAVLFALSLLLVPGGLGALLARSVARRVVRRWVRWMLWPLLAFAPLLVTWAACRHVHSLSVWDALLASLSWLLGVSLSPAPPRHVAAQLVLGALLAEVALRVVSPAAVSAPRPRDARLVMPTTHRDPPCHVMYADDDFVRSVRMQGVPGRATVLHIGDSMVAGVGVPRAQGFVTTLEAAEPEVRHVNLGAAGAGPEAYLLTLARWSSSPRPRLAVVYLFVGNDLFDLDREHLCCAGGPLLLDASDRPRRRCPSARWRLSWRAQLVTSAPPFVLRALARPSRLAGRLMNLVIASQQALARGHDALSEGAHDPASRSPRWPLFSARVRALAVQAAELGVPLLAVVLPSRPTLERTMGRTPVGVDYWVDRARGEEGHRRVVEVARGAGIDTLDAWGFVREAMARHGVEAVFAGAYPGDIHFSALGHRLFAAWMRDALRARGVLPSR